jgi:ornithine carbamoyltransferase
VLSVDTAAGSGLHAGQLLRHLTRVADLERDALAALVGLAQSVKSDAVRWEGALRGRAIALVFEDSSNGAKVSFEAAAARLGATPVALAPIDLAVDDDASPGDAIRALSGYVDAIVVQASAHATVERIVQWSTVPVLNVHSDAHRPCQALADLVTVAEELGDLFARKLVLFGDGNDPIVRSLLEAAALSGLDVTVASPPGYEPAPDVLRFARALAFRGAASIQVEHDPQTAVAGADVLYAHAWPAQRADEDGDRRWSALAPYRVTEALLACAQPGAIFLHCLPARRGEDVDAGVIDGRQSAVWRQSANQLPAVEAMLLWMTRGEPD